MPRKLIQPSDIEDFEQGKAVKIFGAYSSYLCSVTLAEGPQISFEGKRVWDLSDSNFEQYPGWQDDAKEAIAKHNNEIVNSSE